MLSQRPLAFAGENQHAHPAHFKTPGKGLRKENALGLGGPTTVHGKGKAAQTPFHSALQPKTAAKSGLGVKPILTISRPLLDKTPFPNRVQPAPARSPAAHKTPCPQKAAKPAFLLAPEQAQTPGAALRPSSLRKSLRAPRSGGKPALSSGDGVREGEGLAFKTPLTRGNHWDVSDGDVSVGAGEQVDLASGGAEVEEDDDEIEYMPPKVTERPYEPWFEMPDYKQVGAGLHRLMYVDRFDDTADVYFGQDLDLQEIDTEELLRESGAEWEPLALPELEDDSPFARSSTSSTSKEQPQPGAPQKSTPALRTQPPRTSRAPASTPAPVPASRPATRTTSRIAATGATNSTPRPGTAASIASTSTTTLRRPATRSTAAAGVVPTTRPATRSAAGRVTRGATDTVAEVVATRSRSALPRPATRQSGRAEGAEGAAQKATVEPSQDLLLVFEHETGLEEDFTFQV